MLSYALRDLARNPRRTLASLVGVALAVGLFASITFFVDGSAARMTERALAPVPIDMQAAVTSPLAPPAATGAPADASITLEQLAQRVAKLLGVKSSDPLAAVDLPAGSLRSGTQTVAQPVRIFAFDPNYLQHYQLVKLTAGQYQADGALLSPDAALALGIGPGSPASLTIPGRATPLAVQVGGIADFSKADALFASRSPDNQGEFVQVPNVVVVPISVFEAEILPALRADAAAASPALKPPFMELDLHIDRAQLATDPIVAVITTRGLKRSIERTAPGQVAVTDNLSDALTAARGDTILAKILFLFLGLPGVLLAAYLSRYAGGLLARAQRREQATLRARGAQPRHLVRVLTFTTAFIAFLGTALGLLLGAVTVFFALGPAALFSAAPDSLRLSIGLSLVAGLLTTALALYLPARRALAAEAATERRELAADAPPVWLRLRLDFAFLAAAALVWFITVLSGGFKPTAAEGQSVSLSFYTLLAPLLGWLGATLLAVRLLLLVGARLSRTRRSGFGGLTAGTLRRSVERRSLSLASGIIAVALAVAFGSSLLLLVATYDAEKQADARFVTGSDLRVTPSALSTQTPAFADKLKVAGVEGVTPVAQTSSAVVGTDKRALVAIDPKVFPTVASLPDSFFSGITANAAMAALRKDPAGLLVSTELARTFDVQAGDQVRIQLTDKTGKKQLVTFHAVGQFKNLAGFPQGIDLVANLDFYQAAVKSQQVGFFLVHSSDPSPTGVSHVAGLLKAGPGHTVPLLVETTATAINRDSSTLAALNLRGLSGLETVFTLLMSAAGIAIFVFGLLLQRRKEYVTMQALGIRHGQLRNLVLGEAAVVAVLSLLIGGAVGLAMAVMFVQILAPIFTIAPSALAIPVGELSVLATLVLASLGSSVLFASRGLRRLNPVELLREE
jgi:putative ABC transport system permease protein